MRTLSTSVLAVIASFGMARASTGCSMTQQPVAAETAAVEATSNKNAAALEKLFSMLAPGMDSQHFMRTSFEQNTVHYSTEAARAAANSQGAPEGWSWPAFGLAEPGLSDSILTNALKPGSVRAERSVDGHMEPFQAGTDAKTARSMVLDEGGSMVVHLDEEDGALGALRQTASDAFGVPISANLYISGKQGSALEPHTDRWDTFILQLEGAKEWTVCVPRIQPADLEGTCLEGASEPLNEAIRAEIGESQARSEGGCTQYGGPAWVDGKGRADMDCRQVVTKAGDFFYMPKGVIHKATEAGDGVSAHVTMGIPRPGIQFIDLESATINHVLTTAGDSYGESERTAAAVLRSAARRAAQGTDGISFRRTVPVWSLTEGETAIVTPEMLTYHRALVADIEREARSMVSALDLGIEPEAHRAHGKTKGAHPLPYAMATERAWQVHQALTVLLHRLQGQESLATALVTFRDHHHDAHQHQHEAQPAAAARALAQKSSHIMVPGRVSAYELAAAGIKPLTAATLAMLPTADRRRMSFITSCKATCASLASTCNTECPKTESCDSGCTGSCDGSCTTSCDSSLICTGSCDGSCTGSCDGGCTTGCDKFKITRGWYSCDGWCTKSCDSSCITSCDSSCLNTGGCDSGCTGSCDNGCTTGCDQKWTSCTNGCASALATCESGCEVADDIYQQVKDFAVDLAQQVSDIVEDVQDCIDEVSSFSVNSLESLVKCGSYVQSGHSTSLRFKTAEAVKAAIDGLSATDRNAILSSQTVSDSTCTAIWNAVQADMDVQQCWINQVNAFPDLNSCHTGNIWSNPVPALSFGYDRTANGKTEQYQIGVWARLGTDRGCFVSTGETPSGSSLSEASDRWTFTMFESKSAMCATTYRVDAGATLGYSGGVTVGAQDGFYKGDVPTTLGLSGAVSGTSILNDQQAARYWVNANSVISNSGVENPSSTDYCPFTNLWSNAASRRRLQQSDASESTATEEPASTDATDEVELAVSQTKAALGMYPGLSSHDLNARAEALAAVSSAMQAAVPEFQCELSVPSASTPDNDDGTSLAALPGAGSHVPRDSWVHQAWATATELHADLMSLEAPHDGMLDGTRTASEREQAMVREWLQAICGVLQTRNNKIMPLFDAWPYMPVDPEEAAALRTSIESDLMELQASTGAVVESLRIGFEGIQAHDAGSEELVGFEEAAAMLDRTTAAQALLQANLTQAHAEIEAMREAAEHESDEGGSSGKMDLGAGLGIGGAVGCVAGVLLAGLLMMALGRRATSSQGSSEGAAVITKGVSHHQAAPAGAMHA